MARDPFQSAQPTSHDPPSSSSPPLWCSPSPPLGVADVQNAILNNNQTE
ncbi:hypothetical protein A2U01_0107200 [Trifolium medium]|uniref:Uncharacterized protein n=1 Tax=Trifolium medium TaxID=97028 RepID=A0A392VG46_9FABA|nr:hypothetical protein [Trifolium medium]